MKRIVISAQDELELRTLEHLFTNEHHPRQASIDRLLRLLRKLQRQIVSSPL